MPTDEGVDVDCGGCGAPHARGGVQFRDACIVPLIDALNAVGMVTVASCCGHGKRAGNIALADGREVIIAPGRDIAAQMLALLRNPDRAGELVVLP